MLKPRIFCRNSVVRVVGKDVRIKINECSRTNFRYIQSSVITMPSLLRLVTRKRVAIVAVKFPKSRSDKSCYDNSLIIEPNRSFRFDWKIDAFICLKFRKKKTIIWWAGYNSKNIKWFRYIVKYDGEKPQRLQFMTYKTMQVFFRTKMVIPDVKEKKNMKRTSFSKRQS
jgi:hypothetical protein